MDQPASKVDLGLGEIDSHRGFKRDPDRRNPEIVLTIIDGCSNKAFVTDEGESAGPPLGVGLGVCSVAIGVADQRLLSECGI